MNRGAGTGLIAFGLVLAIVGAILEFAVTATTRGININVVGMIVLIVGVVSFVVGCVVLAVGGRQRTIVTQDVRDTPHGQARVEERDDWSV